MMQPSRRPAYFIDWLVGAWVCLCYLSLLPAQAQQAGTPEDLIRAHGQGLLPVEATDLTATERMATARTIALVDALGELVALTKDAAFLPSGSPGFLAGRPQLASPSSVQLGGVLTVSRSVVMEGSKLDKWATVLTWAEQPEVASPGRIVIENWTLVSPPVRHLDLYTLLRNVHEAGIIIERWDFQKQEGLMAVEISASRSRLHAEAIPASGNLVLFTAEEADQLRLTGEEWLVAVDMPRISHGPHIVLRHPEVDTASDTPTIQTTSPTALQVLFQENRAPVDMASLRVWAKKGIFSKSLTQRLQPYIRGTSLEAQGLELPTGRFLIGIEIADRQGAKTTQSYFLEVTKP
jgi:hypothetical protein